RLDRHHVRRLVAEFHKRLCESSICKAAVSFAIWLSKTLLTMGNSAKRFSFVGKQASASIPTCSTENGGAKFRKKKNASTSENEFRVRRRCWRAEAKGLGFITASDLAMTPCKGSFLSR